MGGLETHNDVAFCRLLANGHDFGSSVTRKPASEIFQKRIASLPSFLRSFAPIHVPRGWKHAKGGEMDCFAKVCLLVSNSRISNELGNLLNLLLLLGKFSKFRGA